MTKHYTTNNKPTYRRPPNDGANWKCVDCGAHFTYNEVWLCQTPNGKKSIICETCIDDDWLNRAVRVSDIK